MTADQNEHLSRAIEREGKRLLSFIRKRVADEGIVEDILQDVFYYRANDRRSRYGNDEREHHA